MVASIMMSTYPSYAQPDDRYQLTDYLQWIWQCYFSDSPILNEITIAYSYPWKGRLGLIKMSLDATVTFIGINTLLQMQQVPEYVLITTIAHELVHYIHGFGSPLPRRYKHPHANKVVDRELEQRNLGAALRCCNEWIDKYWYSFYDMQRAAGWVGIQETGTSPYS
ncbi:hypothetical protein KDA_23290 [Dictyobacter alpinus]|uniref:SprT-like domain-containing protein n=1 Tax=Dictyobacter alpinus TaxID=2014873 RepID=A0A402B681_9CHLR|nr:hypothetical protein [Dictyobacter alpinus]GCE26845.1 hypothetical protein KDA_23290 [Dictyobacter alpinus]